MSYDPAFSTDEDQKYVISPFSPPISGGCLSSSNNIRKESMEQWDNYPRIEQPTDLRIKLFPHQLVTVYNMEQLERLRKIKKTDDTFFMTDFGILGDIPGYGKSFSVVSLILRDKMSWDISKRNEKTDIYTYNSCLKVVEKTMKTRVRANLLVVSPTLVEQWKEYFSFVK